MMLSNIVLITLFLIDLWYWNACLFHRRNEKIPYICLMMFLINYALIEHAKSIEISLSFEYVFIIIKEWIKINSSFSYAFLAIKGYFLNLPLEWQYFIEKIEHLNCLTVPNIIFFNALIFVYWSRSIFFICVLAMINNFYFLTINYADYGWFYYCLFSLTIFVYICFNHRARWLHSDFWWLLKYMQTILLIFDFASFISQLCGYDLEIADLAFWLFIKITEFLAQIFILWFYSTIIKYATLILDGYLSNYKVRFHRTSWFKDNLLGTAGMYVVIALSILTMFLTQIKAEEFIENPVFLREGLYFIGAVHIGLILHYPNNITEDRFIILNTCGIYLPILAIRNILYLF